MSEVHVFRVLNPDVLDIWPLDELLHTAFSHPHSPGEPEEVMDKLRWLIPHETVALFVARQEFDYRGLCVLSMPKVSIGTPRAAIYYLYSDGSRRVSGALVREAAELAAARGYGSLTITNRNGRDAVFSRLVRPYLGRGQPQGTAFYFDL